MSDSVAREMSVDEMATEARKNILSISEFVLAMKSSSKFRGEAAAGENHGEAIANIMLAYRHLEDARMRLGKVMQAMNGGESVYSK